MNKKTYIVPLSETVHVKIEKHFCWNSENGGSSATSGDGYNGSDTPGNGDDKQPGEGERGAKEFNIWEAWD